MIQKSSTRRRFAALASGALVAGGLMVAPQIGLSAANAAPVDLDYTCSVSGAGQTKAQPTTVSLELTVPEAVAPGAAFPVSIAATLDMGSASFGPVTGLTADFAVPLTVGGVTSVVTLDPASAPLSDLVFTTTGTGNVTAPAELGALPITVGEITDLDLKTEPDFGVPATATCVPEAAQDQTVGTVTVSDEVEPVAVPVTGAVKITGTPKVGKTLKAVPGKTDGATVKYQWLAGGKAIKGATKPSLKMTKAMKGKKVSVKVTYSKDGFLPVVQTSKPVTVKK